MINKIKNLFNKKEIPGETGAYKGQVEFSSSEPKKKGPSLIIKAGLTIIVLAIAYAGITIVKPKLSSKRVETPIKDELNVGSGEDTSNKVDKRLINKNMLAYNKDGFFTLYDENEKLIDELAVFNQSEDEEGEGESIDKPTDSISLISKSDDYGIFKTNKGDLFLVLVEGNEIKYRNILNQRKDVSVAYYYDNTVYAIESSKLLIQERGSDEVTEVNVAEEINNIIVTDAGVLYTAEEKLYLANFDGSLMDEVSFGEKTEDLFEYNDKVFVINDFGKGKNNSILAEITIKSSEELDKDSVITITKSLNVNKITELKGKRSKLVDVKGDVLFIEQIDSLKSINLPDLSPDKSYKKELRKSNSFINNGFMYETSGNKIIKYDLSSKEEVKSELSISNKYILLNK